MKCRPAVALHSTAQSTATIHTLCSTALQPAIMLCLSATPTRHRHTPQNKASSRTQAHTKTSTSAHRTQRATPTPHDSCRKPASYSRQQHQCPRPGPAAAAHTPRVLPHWHNEVPFGRRSAQRSQPQRSMPCMTLCTKALQPVTMLWLSAIPTRHRNILQHTPSTLHTPQLTYKHPKAPAAHRAKPTPHDACEKPACYSRSRHSRPRYGPVAAAHTRRVLANWHNGVPSSRPSAQRIQPQPTHVVHNTT
jgi:hypothetical protein